MWVITVIVLIPFVFSIAPVSGATEYKRSLPLDDLNIPLLTPPGSELTLQKDETFGIGNPSNGYRPIQTSPNTPMIGITIKPPTEPQR